MQQHPARRKSPKLDELQASLDQERHQVQQAEQTSRSIAAISEGLHQTARSPSCLSNCSCSSFPPRRHLPCHGSVMIIVTALRAGDADARERLFSLGGDALAEQLDFREGADVDPEQLKAAAAAHARRSAPWLSTWTPVWQLKFAICVGA